MAALVLSFSLIAIVVGYFAYLIKVKNRLDLIAGYNESYKGDKSRLQRRVGNGLFTASLVFVAGIIAVLLFGDYLQEIAFAAIILVVLIIVATAIQSGQ